MERYYFEKSSKDEKLFVLIYDISDNRRRYKVAKLMESYGIRVQESAFECCLTAKKYTHLKSLIPKLIDTDDSVRIYPIMNLSDVVIWNGEISFLKTDVIII